MSEVRWTEEQQAVIAARGCDLLVSAAAGSGKTAVLTERITQRVTDAADPLDIDRLLVVTFTRAAAGEMKDRIADAVALRAAERPDDLRLSRQATLVHHAHIETIDSFCSWVVRSHFDLAGIEPDARVADPTEGELLRQETAQKVLNRWYEAEDAAFLQLVECYTGVNQDARLVQMVLDIAEKADSQPDPEAWVRGLTEPYRKFGEGSESGIPEAEMSESGMSESGASESRTSEASQPSWLTEMSAEAAAEIDALTEENRRLQELAQLPGGPALYLDALRADADLLAPLTGAATYTQLHAGLAGLTWARLSSKKSDADPDLREMVKNRRNAFKARLTALAGKFAASPEEIRAQMQQSGAHVETLCRLTLDFLETFAAEKRRRNLLDFSDMEHLALQILQGADGQPSPAAQELAGLFDEVMVDEYQDSNDLQEAILTLVSRLHTGGHNRFMVGDVKQSIYSFRQARPQLFTDKMEQYSAEPDAASRRIDLTRNFRSRTQVLDAVNAIFERVMHRDLGRVEYDTAARLYPGAEGYEPRQAPVYGAEILLACDCDTEPDTQGLRVRAAEQNAQTDASSERNGTPKSLFHSDDSGIETSLPEARMIGQRIRQLMADPDFRITDRENGQTIRRPLQYRDVVILLRAPGTAGRAYADTLMQMNIPAYLPSADGFFSAPEIRVMLSLLSVIENPLQDIPLAAVLRSPMVGLTDEQLRQIRAAAPTEYSFAEAVEQLWMNESAPHGIEDPNVPETPATAARPRADGSGLQGTDTQDAPEAAALEEIRSRLAPFRALLNRARQDMADTPIHELISALLAETDYLTYVTAMPGGELRRANLQKLVDVAVRFESTSYRGLYRFMSYIRQMKKYETDYGMAEVAEAGNAVRIVSIHKSKGLEYPVVFVAGLHRKFNLQDANGDMVLHDDLGIGLSAVDPVARTKCKTLYQTRIREQLHADQRGEELRVLYVAMTRAKEKLILTADLCGKSRQSLTEKWKDPAALTYAARRAAQCFLDWVMPAALEACNEARLREDGQNNEAAGLLSIRWIEEAAFENQGKTAGAERAAALPTDAETSRSEHADLLKQRLTYEYPWTVNASYKQKYSVSEIKHRMIELAYEDEASVPVWISGRDGSVHRAAAPQGEHPAASASGACIDRGNGAFPEATASGAAFGRSEIVSPGALRGTAMHRVLECYDLAREDYRESLSLQICKMRQSGKLTEEQAGLLTLSALETFLTSPLAARMHAAAAQGRYHAETPFFMGGAPSEFLPLIEPREDEEMIFVQGIIDAWFLEGEKIVLVDYKTDRVAHGDELIRRYEAQMRLYARALTRAQHKEVSECVLYSFALSEPVEISL